MFRVTALNREYVRVTSPKHGYYVVHRGWLTVYRDMEKKYGLTKAEMESLSPGYARKRGKR